MTTDDIADFAALDPFFRIIEKELQGVADGKLAVFNAVGWPHVGVVHDNQHGEIAIK
ncbi:hypothetical protein [Streptosporangium lutulentum]|uniref:Uncharacterized protein n=1 Tax=Streptosporangium lutulentum TaxID=1461250 RepID=A0ABT9Q9A3_9ACTN|nr:hypothetical protein [Streptosporangium lutulentum]MDP9842976.1 hypothetical protein [Streptosporangium lutulentum]